MSSHTGLSARFQRRGTASWLLVAVPALLRCALPSFSFHWQPRSRPAAGELSVTGRARTARHGVADAFYASRRADAKAELLRLTEDFRLKQEQMWNLTEAEAKKGDSKNKKSSLLNADSFASQQVMLSDELATLRNETAKVIRKLATLTPTQKPMLGWRGYGDVAAEACALNGTWKLIFTDAADATFRRGRRGDAFAFQELDAAEGWFVNCVNFSNPESTLQGFRVFVEGEALSDTEMKLSFRKVKLLRRSRFPKLFGVITIPLPPPDLLRNIGRFFAKAMGGKVNPSDRGAGFTQLYLDDELRAHETFDGLFFVQKRLS